MEDNKFIFRLISTKSENTAEYAEKLSKAGFYVYKQGGGWYIELLYAKELFEIHQMLDEELIITSNCYFEPGGKPAIEVYDDYRE